MEQWVREISYSLELNDIPLTANHRAHLLATSIWYTDRRYAEAIASEIKATEADWQAAFHLLLGEWLSEGFDDGYPDHPLNERFEFQWQTLRDLYPQAGQGDLTPEHPGIIAILRLHAECRKNQDKEWPDEPSTLLSARELLRILDRPAVWWEHHVPATQ